MKTEIIDILSSLKSHILGFKQEVVFKSDIITLGKHTDFNEATDKKIINPDIYNIDNWENLKKRALACMKCGLYSQRHHVVFGEGNKDSMLLIIGEAPGREEDSQGKPFVGEAGKLLTKMLAAINIERDRVFITNILKCRPPQNRDPKPEEIAACSPILREQINIIKPKVIFTLGRYSSSSILKTNKGIKELRGKSYDMKDYIVVPSFHPAALLRNKDLKKYSWIDLQILRDILNEKGFYN